MFSNAQEVGQSDQTTLMVQIHNYDVNLHEVPLQRLSDSLSNETIRRGLTYVNLAMFNGGKSKSRSAMTLILQRNIPSGHLVPQ